MAVATAAATTMANNAETARPRRRTAARTSMRRNIEVCGPWERRVLRLCAVSDSSAHTTRLTEQTRERGIQPAGSRQRCRQTSPGLRWLGSQAEVQVEM